MTDVLLVAHHDRPEAAALTQSAATWLSDRGHRPWITAADAEALGLPELLFQRPPATAGLAISLGGRRHDAAHRRPPPRWRVPFIGVNVGHLGYLTELEPAGLDLGDRVILRRRRVHGEIGADDARRSACVPAAPRADPGTGRRSTRPSSRSAKSGHTVRLLVRIDGIGVHVLRSRWFDHRHADRFHGLLLVRSWSRGLAATSRACRSTPVSPHMLFDRSLVLDPDELVEIEVLGGRPAILSIDGQYAASLARGDVVVVTPAAHDVRFVRFSRRRFHQILKSKFGLADR